MKNIFYLLSLISLFTFSQVIAQQKQADYLNFNKTKALIKTDLDSAYVEIQFFTNTTYQYDYLMGLYYKHKKEYQKSKSFLLSSIKENNYRKSSEYLDAYYYLGYNYRRLGMLDSGQYYFNEAIAAEKKLITKIITAKALGGLGIVFRQKNEIDSAIHYINLSNIEYKKLGDTLGLARVQNTLGNLYRNFDVKLAIKHYLKALNYYVLLNSRKEIAIIKQNLGLIFSDEEKYEIALDYLKDAYQFFVDEDYLQYQIISLNNIGYTYLNLEEYSEAEEILLKAIRINTEFTNALAFSYLNLGTGYKLQKHYSKAEVFLKKALIIAKDNQLEYLLIEIYHNLVFASSMQNKHKDFEEYFEAYNTVLEETQDENIKNALAKYENELETIETRSLLEIAIKDKKLREQEIEEHITSISTKNILIGLGGLIILLLIVVVVTIYRANKKRKEFNIAIQKRNTIIEKYNTELESIVEERTEELIIAKNKAEESDILKSTFLANISHEIRTPLNSIMGFSDLMSETEVDKENISKYGKIIRNNGFELLNIIDDIIDVSKIEANMFVCDIETIKHSSIISVIENENFEKSKYYSKGADIDFNTSFSEEDVHIKADLYKLNIVFNKLINNAFQFTEEGFINISSEIKNNKVHFSISDSGIGIPEERLSQIFENFRKYNNDQKVKYRGLGVGLYIAHHILLKMSSKLEVESVDGKGSTFSFKLDVVK